MVALISHSCASEPQDNLRDKCAKALLVFDCKPGLVISLVLFFLCQLFGEGGIYRPENVIHFRKCILFALEFAHLPI